MNSVWMSLQVVVNAIRREQGIFKICFKLGYLTQYCMGPYEIQKILARLAQSLLHWWKPHKMITRFWWEVFTTGSFLFKNLKQVKMDGKKMVCVLLFPFLFQPFLGVTSISTLICCNVFEITVQPLWKCLSLSWSIVLCFSLSRWANSFAIIKKIIHDDIWSKPFWK